MPKRILLADDSITIQKVVELTFSDGDYEVVAVNNGAKAIQRLGEMRPDIILSDIIMPEKNGYEVCEYVKSHPELRNIPVILLTGTFEPFDPDRADKAGCDAVVTKPFESQSLIQKVEELISQASQAPVAAAPAFAAPAPPPPPPPAAAPAPSPWDDDVPSTPSFEPPTPEVSPFSTGTTHGGFTPAPFPANDNDIFGAAPSAPQPTTEMPFETEFESGGETRAFPRMSFEDLQRMTPAPEPEPEPEPSPWGAPPPDAPIGGQTQAFPSVSFEDLQRASQPEEARSPWDEESTMSLGGGETRAFPSTSFDDFQSHVSAPEPEPPAPAAAEEPTSPWEEPPAFGGETRAFPRMSYDELQSMQSAPAPAPEPEAEPEVTPTESLWDEPPAFGGETRAFPRMSYDELQSMQSSAPVIEPEPEPEPEAAPEPIPTESLWDEPAAPEWSTSAEAEPEPEPSYAPVETSAPFVDSDRDEPESEGSIFAPEDLEPEAPAAIEEPSSLAAHEPVWSTQDVTEVEPVVPAAALTPAAAPVAEAPAAAASTGTGDLTDEQIDRIARRVVQLMSDQVVRNIAWEVIPDLAEMVVKERIRQLEAE